MENKRKYRQTEHFHPRLGTEGVLDFTRLTPKMPSQFPFVPGSQQVPKGKKRKKTASLGKALGRSSKGKVGKGFTGVHEQIQDDGGLS